MILLPAAWDAARAACLEAGRASLPERIEILPPGPSGGWRSAVRIRHREDEIRGATSMDGWADALMAGFRHVRPARLLLELRPEEPRGGSPGEARPPAPVDVAGLEASFLLDLAGLEIGPGHLAPSSRRVAVSWPEDRPFRRRLDHGCPGAGAGPLLSAWTRAHAAFLRGVVHIEIVAEPPELSAGMRLSLLRDLVPPADGAPP